METIFFHCLRYVSRSSSSRLVKIHFPVQKEKYCFLPRTFFPASGNHYLNYREAYLKPLSLLLATIFFDFSYISGNVSIFLSNRNGFFNKFSILARGTYSFIWTFFYGSGNPVKTIRKITLFVLVETDFLDSRNHFLLPFSETPATDSFIFPSNGNVFWLVTADSLAIASHYVIYFQTFIMYFWNKSLILASRNGLLG